MSWLKACRVPVVLAALGAGLTGCAVYAEPAPYYGGAGYYTAPPAYYAAPPVVVYRDRGWGRRGRW